MTTRILKYKKSIVITFLLLPIISAAVQFGVPVNHDMVDYLPDDTPPIASMDVMDEEFDGAVANTRVRMKDVSIQEAVNLKEKLEAVDGVSGVMGRDAVRAI